MGLQTMNTPHPALRSCAALLALFLAVQARGQVPASPLEIKSIAEVESRATEPKSGPGGRAGAELVPADRVVPGDRVIYTLEVRNSGATPVDAPEFTYPVPEHMRYVAGSAVGPGAEVSFSVDGGHSFARAEDLKVKGPDGKLRAAVAADYTDIRWQLKNSLKANSVAFVRFRTLVK
jgi:uncharacterized repeat protein (TIGR01451 family)